MKKSLFKLIAGLICFAGFGSANAAIEIGDIGSVKEYSDQELRDSVRMYYRNAPLVADEDGIALHYDTYDNSIYFTDNVDSSEAKTRKYVFGYYGDGKTSVSMLNWQYCQDKFCLDGLPQEQYVLSFSEKVKGGFQRTARDDLFYKTKGKIYNTIHSMFNKGNWHVHMALDSIKVDGVSQTPAKGMFSKSVRKNGTVAMYYIDFYKEPRNYMYISSHNTETFDFDQTNLANYSKEQKYTIQHGDSVRLGYFGIMHYDSTSVRFQYRLLGYLHSINGADDVTWVDYPMDPLTLKTVRPDRDTLGLMKNIIGIGNRRYELQIDSNVHTIQFRAITKQLYAKSMGYREDAFAEDTSAAVSVKIKYKFKVRAPYSYYLSASGGGGYSFFTNGYNSQYYEELYKLPTVRTESIEYNLEEGRKILISASPTNGHQFRGWFDYVTKEYISKYYQTEFFFNRDFDLIPLFEEIKTDIKIFADKRPYDISPQDILPDEYVQKLGEHIDVIYGKSLNIEGVCSANGILKYTRQYRNSSTGEWTQLGKEERCIANHRNYPFWFGRFVKSSSGVDNEYMLNVSDYSFNDVPFKIQSESTQFRTCQKRYSGTDGSYVDESCSNVLNVYWNYHTEAFAANGTSLAKAEDVLYGGKFYFPNQASDIGVPDNELKTRYSWHWVDTLHPDEPNISRSQSYVTIKRQSEFKAVIDTSYLVTFVAYDPITRTSVVLQNQWISRNAAASEPTVPQISGYDFVGWDKDFSKVTEPMTITTIYEKPYDAKKEIRANQCGDLWCGVKQDEKVNTGFSESQSGWWFGFTDKSYGGSSTVKYATGADVNANIQNAYSIDLTFDIEAGYDYPFAGIGFDLGNSENGKDISDWNGFCLAYKSSAAVSLQLVPENDMQVEYNYHFYSLKKSSDVSFVNISWNQFGQESGWGIATDVANVLNSVKKIQIRATADADFKLVTLGRYGTCNGESYVAKKEIEESKCGDLWCGVKQETVVNTGFTGKDAGTFFDYNDAIDGGNSSAELTVGGDYAENIQKSYAVDFTVNIGYDYLYPYGGIGFVIGENGNDISDWDGVCLAYVSNAAATLEIAPVDEATSTQYNNFKVTLPKASTVAFKQFSWNQFEQERYWGITADIESIVKKVQSIKIKSTSNNNFKLVTLGRYNSCNGASRVVLDWSEGSDDIVVDNLDENAFIRIASDKQYYANGKIYEGVLTSADLSDLAGATLKPISGVALSGEGENVEAELSGATIDDKLVIPAEISVAHIEIEREFKGTNSTLMVPFRVDVDTNDVKLVKVERVFKDTELGQWVAEGTRAESIEAHTPYVINFTGKLSFDNVTLVPNVDVNTTATFGNWTFKGAYNGKTWTADDPEMGKAYGFSGVTKPEAGITQGQFVKIGNNAKVAPMRAYLVYEKKAVSPMPGIGIMKAAAVSAEEETLPSSIILRVVDKKNEVVEETVIETPVVENPAVDDVVDEVIQGIAGDKLNSVEEKPVRWYDFQGRRLHKKPTARGAYIKNNKNVLSK